MLEERAISHNCLYHKQGADLGKSTMQMLPVCTTSLDRAPQLCSCSHPIKDARSSWTGTALLHTQHIPRALLITGCSAHTGRNRALTSDPRHSWDEVMWMRKQTAIEKEKEREKRKGEGEGGRESMVKTQNEQANHLCVAFRTSPPVF